MIEISLAYREKRRMAGNFRCLDLDWKMKSGWPECLKKTFEDCSKKEPVHVSILDPLQKLDLSHAVCVEIHRWMGGNR